jgi:hypothetical protein
MSGSRSAVETCSDGRQTAGYTVLHTGRVNGDSDEFELTASGALDLLTAVDPYGLKPGMEDGAPGDEYLPEAAALARILLEQGNITVQEVEAVWSRSFSESLVARLGTSRVAVLTRDLNDLRRTGR